MSHLLNGAFAKVERANRHIQHLSRDISVFLKKHPYTIRREKDLKNGLIRFVASASTSTDPPIDFALLAGEVAHQLRSALDHAVFELCSLRYRRPPKHLTQFPIFDTRAGFIKRGRSKIKDIPKS